VCVRIMCASVYPYMFNRYFTVTSVTSIDSPMKKRVTDDFF